MSSLIEDLDDIKDVEDGLVGNKVANFAYEDSAYTNNQVNGVDDYNVSRAQNIPNANASILKVNATILAKGFRAQASSITRMLVNHFFGRVSYNLNKIHDNFSAFLTSLKSYIGQPNGIASLDENGRIPYSQLPESALEWKGEWDASTNTPHLEDGTGTSGDMYIVTVAGTQDLGSGDISFLVNDRVIYNGTVWQRFAGGDVRTVSEIPPDTNGNVDLSLQTDITKILAPNIIAKLFGKDMAKNWKKAVLNSAEEVAGIIGSVEYNSSLLIYGNSGVYLLNADFSCTCIYNKSVTACGVIAGTVVIGNSSGEVYFSDDLQNWEKETINATSFSYVRRITHFYTANNLCLMFTASYSDSNVARYIYWSTDGKTWTASSSFGSYSQGGAEWLDVKYNGTLWVVCLQDTSAGKIYSSSDGKSWSSRKSFSSPWFITAVTGTFGNLIQANASRWTILSCPDSTTWTSTNGTSWSELKINNTSFFCSKFVTLNVNDVLYYGATIKTSPFTFCILKTSDLQSFTNVCTLDSSDDIIDILLYSSTNGFLALKNYNPYSLLEGAIYSSMDGDNWIKEADTNPYVYSPVVGNNNFNNKILVNRDNKLVCTSDFIIWDALSYLPMQVTLLNSFNFKGTKVGVSALFADKDNPLLCSQTSELASMFNGVYINAGLWNNNGCRLFLGTTVNNKVWVNKLKVNIASTYGVRLAKCVTNGNTILFYASDGNTVAYLVKTSNLEDWEDVVFHTDFNLISQKLNDLCCVDNKFFISTQVVSSGSPEFGTFISVDECATWTKVSNKTISKIKQFNSLFLGVSYESNKWLPVWSSDGEIWNEAVVPSSSGIEDFTEISGLLIGWGKESKTGLYWSSDGKNWTAGTGTNISSYKFAWVKKLGSLYFASSFTHGLYWSIDGKAWTQCSGTNMTSATIQDVAFADGLYVCTEFNGTKTFWSTDGKAWTQGTLTLNANEKLMCVAYAGGVWVIGGTEKLYRSTDGKTFDVSVSFTGFTTSLENTGEWIANGSALQYSGFEET